MGRWRVAAVMIVAGLLLAGCATAPEIPYDRSGGSPVKTIAILTPSFPDRPAVILATTVGQSFGLIGAVIDASMQANRESQLRRVVEQQSFSMQDCFIERLNESLIDAGYTVTVVPLHRDRADFATHYPAQSEVAADAYLDLVANGYGYIAAGIRSSTPYRPFLHVQARLVSAKDSSVLMQDVVMYNAYGDPKHIVTIAPDPNVQFKDFDTLMRDPQAAIDGMRTAAEQSAQTITKLLR